MRTMNRRARLLSAGAAIVAVAGIATAATALDAGADPVPADPTLDAALTEVADRQGRPVVDGSLRRALAEDASRGGLGAWSYRAEGRDEVMVTRSGDAVFLAGCPAADSPLRLCALRMRGGEGVIVLGRSGPGVDAVMVRSAIAARTVTPVAGHWLALLPDAAGNPDSALPTEVRALSSGTVVAEVDPGLPGR